MGGFRRLRLLSLLGPFAFLAATTMIACAAAAPKFGVDPFWPKPLPNNWAIGQVSGVAVDGQDNIWIIQRPRSLSRNERAAALNPPQAVCCTPAPPVIEFNQAGDVVRAWGGPGAGYDWPLQEHGIRVDSKGFVWLGGNAKEDASVLKFTEDGKFILQIGHNGPGKGDDDTSQLNKPADIWIDGPANEVYVADGYGNHRVIVFDATTGAFKRMWGAYGKPPHGPAPGAARGPEGSTAYDPKAPPSLSFNNPVHCVKIMNDGLVYVCDRVNDRLQVFHKDGSFVREFSFLPNTLGSGSVWDIYPWPDRAQDYLVMVDGENNQMRVVRRSDGQIMGTYGRFGHNAGEFYGVHNVALDSHGNVYTTEVFEGKRIQKWKPTNGAPQN